MEYFTYTWHNELWQQLISRYQQHKLPHALLLGGHAGMGKLYFARRLAAAILCLQPQPSGDACGICKSCHLLRIDNHPDFLEIQPINATQIKIDQIRAVIDFCTLKASYHSHQVIILHPAESMNRNTSNSLLKLLEEPPPDKIFLLLSHQPSRLIPTIRSRCQRLDFNRTPLIPRYEWLVQQLGNQRTADDLMTLANNAPLIALQWAETGVLTQRQAVFDNILPLLDARKEPLALAAQWSELNPALLLTWLLSLLSDILRYALTHQTDRLINHDYKLMIQQVAPRLPPQQWFKLLDMANETYQLIQSNSNVKIKRLLESLLITWLQTYRRI